MKSNKSPLLLLAVVGLVGCGGSQRPLTMEARHPSGRGVDNYAAPSPPAEPAAEAGSWSRGDSAAPRSSPSRELDARAESAPSSRPGLATEWGERRYSPVRETSFDRSDESPEVLSIHYDDAPGVARVARNAVTGYARARMIGTSSVDVSIDSPEGRSFDTVDTTAGPYVVGTRGARYVIAVTNRTPERIEAVVSVDGIDVVRGKTASFDHRGYLVPPYGQVRIEGFRSGLDDVGTFRFGSVGDSYAASKGDARNVGVIGVAVFHEKGSRDGYLRDTARPFPDETPDPRFATPPRHPDRRRSW
jgi:hypothetical protein